MSPLNPKQILFCELYSINQNAIAVANGVIVFDEIPERYYVYFLINPLNNNIFYIGKGKGNRKDQHLQEHKKQRFNNSAKHSEISEILKAGEEPTVVIFSNNLSEEEAYRQESILINKFKSLKITNQACGQLDQMHLSKEWAKLWLSKVIPFARWKEIKNPTKDEEVLYRKIIASLKDISINGSITRIIQTTTAAGTTITYA